MLTDLHIKNLALIDEEEITFLDGLHILSGETGAGKSIILGALSLALGTKADKDMLRDETLDALVEATFQVTRASQKQALSDLDIAYDDDEVILTRRITDTKSIAKINGETVPAKMLEQVGHIFLDLHSQREHQSLLHKKKHLELLDAYAKDEEEPIKKDLLVAFAEYQKLKKEFESSTFDEKERARELSLLAHEIKELTDADLHPGEDETLEAEYKKFANGKKIAEALMVSDQATGDAGASDAIARALRELSTVTEYDASIASLYDELLEIDGLLSDFHRDLASATDNITFDEESFVATERRLNEINRLKEKYGNSLAQVLDAYEEKEKRYEMLQSYDAYRLALEERMQKSEKQVQSLCATLSDVRKRAADILCEKVRAALIDLNFLEVSFVMQFEETSYTKDGFDEAEFLIRLNPGEPLRPLREIASGGEMSRIMLAIKTVLAENDEVDTLIFDEIDAGISGRTAQAVSEKLSLVAKNHQVICITHLPQIAAMADQHYLIEKEVRDGKTISTIALLSYPDSIQELARLLGGDETTQAALDNAKELKDRAQAKKALDKA